MPGSALSWEGPVSEAVRNHYDHARQEDGFGIGARFARRKRRRMPGSACAREVPVSEAVPGEKKETARGMSMGSGVEPGPRLVPGLAADFQKLRFD